MQNIKPIKYLVIALNLLLGGWIQAQTTNSSIVPDALDPFRSMGSAPESSAVSSTDRLIPLLEKVKGSHQRVPLDSIIQNPSFETPAITAQDAYLSFITAPTNAGWTFVNGAGIAKNGCALNHYQPVGTTNGTQYAFLQGINGTGSSLSQIISNLSLGYYSFTFTASQRCTLGVYTDNTQNQTVTVFVDGTNVGSFTPPDQNWYAYETTPMKLLTGNHTLTFTNVPVPGDATILLDNVGIKEVDAATAILSISNAVTSSASDATTSTNQPASKPPPSYFGNRLPPDEVK
jgi:hypothetical protein